MIDGLILSGVRMTLIGEEVLDEIDDLLLEKIDRGISMLSVSLLVTSDFLVFKCSKNDGFCIR